MRWDLDGSKWSKMLGVFAKSCLEGRRLWDRLSLKFVVGCPHDSSMAPRAGAKDVRTPAVTDQRTYEPTLLADVAAAPDTPNDGSPDALVGTVIAGRYRVDALLGSGGMGKVYRAEHTYMRKPVALKVLHRQMTFVPEVVERFEREAIAAARIEHPNVAKALDFGCLEDGTFYLALEFIEGVSLRAELDRCGPFGAARAVDIARQIAGALIAASAEGIVHRDLKPDNVMLLTGRRRQDHVKVLDFGIAKLDIEGAPSSSQLTRVGAVFGTPEYMSPEQAMGMTVDHRSDLYAVGIIVYEMLSGRTPFAGGNMAAVLTGQLTAEPPPLGTEVPPALRKLVMDLLRKKPEERPQTAEALYQRLGSLGLSQPPPPLLGRAMLAGALATVNDRVEKLETRAERALETLGSRFPQLRVLGRPVLLAGRGVPLGVLVSAAAGLVCVGAVLTSVVGAAHGDPRTPPVLGAGLGRVKMTPRVQTAVAAEESPRVPRQAMDAIIATPVYKRKLDDWTTLGRGHAQYEEWAECVAAYRNALEIRPSLHRDPELVHHIRQAAEHLEAYQAAIGLAITHLGAGGMDLIYDLWSATRGTPERRTIAEFAYKKLQILRINKPSKALRVRLGLEFDRRCPELEKTVRLARVHADTRSAPALEALKSRTGCGADKQQDCHECLRGAGDLDLALATARSHPAPVIDGKTPLR